MKVALPPLTRASDHLTHRAAPERHICRLAHARRLYGLVAWARGLKSEVETRILIAIEDEYRAYREVIAAGMEALRPGVEVTSVGLDLLEGELARLEPQVVVCSGPEPTEKDLRHVWVELPMDPIRPMKIRRGERHSESSDPTLQGLLAVVDEAEQLSRT